MINPDSQPRPVLAGGMYRFLGRELPQVLSTLAFLLVTAGLFRSWEFALIVTASLGFHELGHAIVLAWYKLEYRIYFGVVGAYTWSRWEDRGRLSHLANTYVHLAGPLFSLLLALLAMVLHNLWLPGSEHLLLLANFSAQIGLLNLLPLGVYTDGGKALRRMAISVSGGKGRKRVLAVAAAFVIAPAAGVLIELRKASQPEGLSANLLGLLLVGAWLVAGMLAELRRSGPPVLTGRRMMNPTQTTFVAILIWDMLAAQLMVILSTPFWLAPQYLIGTIENIKAVFYWVVGFL